MSHVSITNRNAVAKMTTLKKTRCEFEGEMTAFYDRVKEHHSLNNREMNEFKTLLGRMSKVFVCFSLTDESCRVIARIMVLVTLKCIDSYVSFDLAWRTLSDESIVFMEESWNVWRELVSNHDDIVFYVMICGPLVVYVLGGKITLDDVISVVKTRRNVNEVWRFRMFRECVNLLKVLSRKPDFDDVIWNWLGQEMTLSSAECRNRVHVYQCVNRQMTPQEEKDYPFTCMMREVIDIW